MEEKLSLVLGCGGYMYHNFILCAGTHNIIVDFNYFGAIKLKEIMDFLDITCSLFDGPMGDWNKIINTLKILYERYHLLDDNTWKALHIWLPQHKHCGAILRLVINADIESIFKTSQELLIRPGHVKR